MHSGKSNKDGIFTEIKERIRLLEKEKEAFKKAASDLLNFDDFETTSRKIFDNISHLTGAKSGYVALLSDDGSENELVFLEAGGLDCTVDEELPMPIRGLREEAYRTHKAVYDNDFMKSDWTKFLPEGHVHLKNVMFAPLNIEGKTVGIIGLANKDSDFTDYDAELANVFGEFAAIALQKSTLTEKRKETEERYSLLWNKSKEGFLIHDFEGNLLEINPELKRLVELDESRDITKLNLSDYLDHEQISSIKDKMEKMISTGEDSAHAEIIYLKKDNIPLFLETQGGVLYKKGKPHAIQTIVHDTTENRMYQIELENLNQKLNSIINNAPLYIYLTDLNDNIMLANNNFAELVGDEPPNLLGKHTADICRPVEAEKYLEQNRIIKEELEVVAFKDSIEDEDGNVRYYDTIKFPLFDADGNIYGICGISRDVTHLRLMEEEMLKAAKLESLGILAGGIAHDFNNILTSILGNLSLIEFKEDLSESSAEALERASTACETASKLTKQLLTFSKGGSPVKKPLKLSGILRDAVSIAVNDSSTIKLIFEMDNNLPSVEADESQINQVFQNLALNSVHAMPDGGTITIKAESVSIDEYANPKLSEGKYLRISFTDTGKGMDEKTLTSIFDPYFTTKESGAGLGLAVVYSVIKKHYGIIEVESTEGKGTSFTIYLPTIETKTKSIVSKAAKKFRGEKQSARARILVMDDEEHIREMLKKMLNSLGYDSEVSKNGREFIEKYEEAMNNSSPFDLVILDLIIPGDWGGKETIKKLLKINPDAKSIAISGYSKDNILSEATNFGFTYSLAKPFTMKELHQLIKNAINQAS